LDEKTTIGKNGVITAWDKYQDEHFSPQIIIGDNVSIGEYCHITAINNKIVIGKGRWLTITDNAHGDFIKERMDIPPVKRPLSTK
jgi:acetyltransferase-like isoleucine patch superfamily enzyme